MRYGALCTICLLLVLFAAGCGDGGDPYDVLDKGGPLRGATPGSSEIQVPILSDTAGKNMVTFKCTSCHSNGHIKKARYSKLEWEVRIQRCKDKPDGAKISPIDAQSLANWLAQKYRD